MSVGLHLLLQLPRILDTESVLEDLPDVLERHALDLRVTEVHRNPTEEANRGVETEGAGGSGVLHLREEGRGDDDVGAPARAGEHHGAVRADFHGEELGGEPGGVAHAGAVEADVDDHACEDDVGGPADLIGLEGEVVVDWDPVEGEGGEGEEECHAPHGGEQDATTTEAIDDHQVDPGEEEVRCCDDGADCYRIGETDESEES